MTRPASGGNGKVSCPSLPRSVPHLRAWWTSVSIVTESSIQSGFPIHHNRHIAAFAEELHNFLARARQLCPLRSRLRVLFESTNLSSIENEIHLPQLMLRGAPNGAMFFA